MERSGQLWIISGPIGSGKTRYCQHLAGQARARGWDVAGVLSPGVFLGERKVAIEVLDLRSGQRRTLAQRVAEVGASGLHTQEWAFDDRVLAWGDALLAHATPCDMLVVDELGPLELERGQGWVSAIPAITSRAYRLALVVLRPTLLLHAAAWGEHHILDLSQPQPLPDLDGLFPAVR